MLRILHDAQQWATRLVAGAEASFRELLVAYESDRGRRAACAIVQLCRRVLTEVYSMRRGDDLDYHFLRKSDVGS